jgi:hypothetical protein
VTATRAARVLINARSSASAIPALRITGAIISSRSNSSRLGSRPLGSHFGTAHLLLKSSVACESGREPWLICGNRGLF